MWMSRVTIQGNGNGFYHSAALMVWWNARVLAQGAAICQMHEYSDVRCALVLPPAHIFIVHMLADCLFADFYGSALVRAVSGTAVLFENCTFKNCTCSTFNLQTAAALLICSGGSCSAAAEHIHVLKMRSSCAEDLVVKATCGHI